MSKAIKRLKELFDQQDNEEEEDEEFNENEGENIVIKGKKQLVKKNINDLAVLQKDMEKYKGKDITYNQYKEQQEKSEEELDEENEDINEEQIEDIEEQVEEEDDIDEEAKADNANKKGNAATKESMDRKDEEYLKTLTQFTPNEIKKAKNVENQKNTYDFFIGIRISLQKLLNAVNTLPFHLTLPKFINEETAKAYNHSISSIQKLQQNLLLLHKKILTKSNLQAPNDIASLVSSLPSQSPIESTSHLLSFHLSLSALSEKITDVWYRKSLVNSFKNNSKILKILNDDFCQHIKTNVNANYNSIRKKTQKIAGDTFLGRKREYHAEEYDIEIYNDLEFYNFLLKEFLINNEKDLSQETGENGSRYDLTMQYILNRNKNKSKNVDTKASKNRKIRYNKHEQLINFMVPQVNYLEIPGRDTIVSSLFGIKRKKKEKRDESQAIDDDIEII